MPEAAAAVIGKSIAPAESVVAAELRRSTILEWIESVFAESIRLYCPAWIIGRQAINDHNIGEYTIPAGGVVLLVQHIVHRDGRWFERPESFEPERWLGEQPKRPRYAYFPFGGGQRQCIGESFAWLEGILLISTLAQRWRCDSLHPARASLIWNNQYVSTVRQWSGPSNRRRDSRTRRLCPAACSQRRRCISQFASRADVLSTSRCH